MQDNSSGNLRNFDWKLRSMTRDLLKKKNIINVIRIFINIQLACSDVGFFDIFKAETVFIRASFRQPRPTFFITSFALLDYLIHSYKNIIKRFPNEIFTAHCCDTEPEINSSDLHNYRNMCMFSFSFFSNQWNMRNKLCKGNGDFVTSLGW